jgi:hypothetical protein
MKERGEVLLVRQQEILVCKDGIDGQRRVLLPTEEEEDCDDESRYLVVITWKWTDTT